MSIATVCPACGDAGGLRPDVVWFGEMPYEMERIAGAPFVRPIFSFRSGRAVTSIRQRGSWRRLRTTARTRSNSISSRRRALSVPRGAIREGNGGRAPLRRNASQRGFVSTGSSPLTAAVVGAGPAGLMAAETLQSHGFSVTVYERMPTPARKLLIAGRGGLNLTHSEGLDAFLARYRGSLTPRVQRAVERFRRSGSSNGAGARGRDLRRLERAGVSEGDEGSPLLRAWLKRLAQQGVVLKSRHRWMGIDEEGALSFETDEGAVRVARPDCRHARAWRGELAASRLGWGVGRNGAGWGVSVDALLPANSGFLVAWSEVFRERFCGEPLKRIAVTWGGETVRGEAMITRAGIEGVRSMRSRARFAARSFGTERLRSISISSRIWRKTRWLRRSHNRAARQASRRFCARRWGFCRRRSGSCRRPRTRRGWWWPRSMLRSLRSASRP